MFPLRLPGSPFKVYDSRISAAQIVIFRIEAETLTIRPHFGETQISPLMIGIILSGKVKLRFVIIGRTQDPEPGILEPVLLQEYFDSFTYSASWCNLFLIPGHCGVSGKQPALKSKQKISTRGRPGHSGFLSRLKASPRPQ